MWPKQRHNLFSQFRQIENEPLLDAALLNREHIMERRLSVERGVSDQQRGCLVLAELRQIGGDCSSTAYSPRSPKLVLSRCA